MEPVEVSLQLARANLLGGCYHGNGMVFQKSGGKDLKVRTIYTHYVGDKSYIRFFHVELLYAIHVSTHSLTNTGISRQVAQAVAGDKRVIVDNPV